MGVMASQNTSLTFVYSTVYSGADQRKHHSPAPLAFVRGIHRVTGHKWPVTRKMFPFDNIIMSVYGSVCMCVCWMCVCVCMEERSAVLWDGREWCFTFDKICPDFLSHSNSLLFSLLSRMREQGVQFTSRLWRCNRLSWLKAMGTATAQHIWCVHTTSGWCMYVNFSELLRE